MTLKEALLQKHKILKNKTKKQNRKANFFSLKLIFLIQRAGMISVLPRVGAYEFWVVKQSLHFILNMSFMIQRKHFLKKGKERVFLLHRFHAILWRLYREQGAGRRARGLGGLQYKHVWGRRCGFSLAQGKCRANCKALCFQIQSRGGLRET